MSVSNHVPPPYIRENAFHRAKDHTMLTVNAVEMVRLYGKGSMVAAGTLKAPDELTIQRIRNFGTELMTLLHTGNPLSVDLSTVQRLDTAGLQLLVQARREACRAGVHLELARPAPIVVETFQFCGLAGELELPA
jgi:anti-sigma B factor antagonist